jgi:MFS family permease
MDQTSSFDLPSDIKSSKGAWSVVILLFFVGALNYLDRVMITTMHASITEELKINDAQFGLLTSVFLWVYGLLSPFAGFLADRFKRSQVIIVSLFVWSFVTWLTAHATTFDQLLATRALMGISEACFIPAALALITDYHKGNTRSLAVGIFMGGVMVGQSAGFIGGWIAEKHHWSDAFNIFGIIGILYSLILLFKLHDIGPTNEKKDLLAKTEQKVNFLEAIIDLFRQKSFILLIINWSLLGIVGWMILGWLPTYYKEHFNLSQAVAGFYATAYVYPFSFLGVILGGYLADKFSHKNPRGRILVPAIGLCIAAPAVLLSSLTANIFLAIVGFIIYALTRVFSDTNLMPILCMISNPKYRATGYGILNMFACVVGGIGIYASGVMRDSNINLNVTFKIGSIGLIICAAIFFFLKIKPHQNGT